MVYDAVGTKSSLPREKEEDVKGQQKLTERDKAVVIVYSCSSRASELTVYTQARWKLIMRLGATLIWVDACAYLTRRKDNTTDVFAQSSDGLT
jgi:hypothetical protein